MLNQTTLLNFNLRWPTMMPGEVAILSLLLVFTLLSTLELHSPNRKLSTKFLRQSYKANISLFVINSIVMSVLSASSLLIVAKHYPNNGLLIGISNHSLKAILAFIALDLLMYVWHIASHRLNALWMFHKVHHNDPYLNISTAFRIHFLELFITNALKAALIILLGIEETIVLTNEAILTAFIMFHHTNITFKAEKLLSYIFIMPSLHETHHSTQRYEHDHNYGAVFSLWDRLFGTLLELKPVEIGLNGHSPLDIINLIKFEFNRHVQPSTQQPINLEAMIAEAAYYKAEKRGFYPGNEIRDWLEAKKDIIALIYENNAIKNKSASKSWRNYFMQIKSHINFTPIQNF